MTGQQKLDIVARLTVLAEVFGRRLSDEAIELYIRALDDLDYNEVVMALNTITLERDTFPPPAAIRRLCRPPAPRLESIARQQAAMVLRSIRQNGARYEPAWDDPITAHLFRTRFRWRSLCATLTEDEERWFVRDFCEAYEAYDADKDTANRAIPHEVRELLDNIGKI